MEAESPVPLDGLAASDTTRTFTVTEAIDGVDRNGDGDLNDSAIDARDRETGVTSPTRHRRPCGISGNPEGRAALRVSIPPFTFPAVAVENDTVAFLESEAGQKPCDQNGRRRRRPTACLRIFRLGLGETTIATSPTVDTAPLIDAAPLAVSSGLVYVRASEPAQAAHERRAREPRRHDDRRASAASRSGSRATAATSCLSTRAATILPRAGHQRAIRRLRATIASPTRTVRVSEALGGGTPNGESYTASFARNGRYVAFESFASNPRRGRRNCQKDIFVRDLVDGTNERVSVADGGGDPDGTRPRTPRSPTTAATLRS